MKSKSYFRKGYGGYTVENVLSMDLNKLHTRELLVILASEPARINPAIYKQIKDILATREHIPTKAESKKTRQEKAKQQKNRG